MSYNRFALVGGADSKYYYIDSNSAGGVFPTHRLEEPAVVKPIDQFGRREFDLLDAAPRTVGTAQFWRYSTMHLVTSLLVPRPRLHLIRFHGVLVTNAMLRALAAPHGANEGAQAPQPAACEADCARNDNGQPLESGVTEWAPERPGSDSRRFTANQPLELRAPVV